MSTLTNILQLVLSCFLLTNILLANGKLPNNIVMNTIDSCWRTKTNWNSNRQSLADCAIGFGKDAIGGKLGKIYEVNDPSDDPINPKPVKLKNELMVNSYKTIDGRGSKVEIGNGPCITINHISHVIVHGVSLRDCKPSVAARIRNRPDHVENRRMSDGDAITIFASSNIWIDHCFLAHAIDGLIDVIHASTDVTISNNRFTDHEKVMLLGHSDEFDADKNMKVTVAFNHFSIGLKERMPRVRFGTAHVVNNLYEEWRMYAIGGSANPTIFSEGNYFKASMNSDAKLVTKRETNGKWNNWNWRSCGDVLLNGAQFVESGEGSCAPPYSPAQKFVAAQASMVPILTRNAGILECVAGKAC